jgi:hypothetical protein
VKFGPVSPSLAARLARLIDQAQAADATFRDAAARAERLAAMVGPSQSESWIAAQQALSAAQAERGPTTQALADIDALAAISLQTTGGIAASDLAAVRNAAERVSAIDRRQAERIDALQARIGG